MGGLKVTVRGESLCTDSSEVNSGKKGGKQDIYIISVSVLSKSGMHTLSPEFFN